MRKVYLDHNATTPLHPEVLEAMRPYFSDNFGNPSSLHGFGRQARVAVEKSRETVASILGCLPEEVIFTSGGTESDNLAIKGVALARQNLGRHIVTSAIEHHAVLEPCHFLEQNGFEVTYLRPESDGRLRLADLEAALRKDTILVSIMHGNNEIGTIQDIAAMAKIVSARGILFHTDAVQTVGKIPVKVNELGVDLLSCSAHKFYGPKGVGALYTAKKVKLQPVIHGGAHEFKRRAGTENVPGIIGLAKALELAARDMEKEVARLRKLTGDFVAEVTRRIPDVVVIGDRTNCVPNTVSMAFRGIEGESILLSLDLKGIAVSTGSACASGAVGASHVLTALGLPPELTMGAIRFSFGRSNTEEDIAYVVDVLEKEVDRIRRISPLYQPQTGSRPASAL